MYPSIPLFGGYAINTYSIFTTLGVVAFVAVCRREAQKADFPFDAFWKLVFLCSVSGIIGSKLGYAFFFDHHRFLASPVETLKHTGWMYLGAFAGGYVGGLALRAVSRYPFVTALDVGSYGAMLGLGVGRLGCFFGGCCYGIHTDSFVGITFPHMRHAVYPTQLFESAFGFLIFGFMYFIRRRFNFPGFQFSVTFIGYGVFRFLIEFIRADSRNPGFQPFTPSQYISLVLIIVGAVVLFVKSRGSEQLRDQYNNNTPA